MALDTKTKSEMLTQITTDLLALEPQLAAVESANLENYSRIRNFIVAIVEALSLEQTNIETVYNAIFYSTADDDSLELHLTDKGLVWGSATKATTKLRIGSTTLPTATYQIPQFFQASTDEDTPKIYQTLASGSISPSTTVDSKGYYTVEIDAESVTAGADYNVSVETISKIVTSIAGINVVYNSTAATGGIDRESTESVRRRLLNAEQIFDRNTVNWFITQATNFSFVKDAYVIASYIGNGTVLVSLAGYSALSPSEIAEVQDFFDDESVKDAGASIVFVDEVSDVPITIEVVIYRLNSTLIRSNTAQTGASGTITLDTSANANDDYYNNMGIEIVSGTGTGQKRIITDYVGSTKVATVNSSWSVTPNYTSVFSIYDNSLATIDNIETAVETYFDEEMVIGKDFVNSKLSAYIIDNIGSVEDIEFTLPADRRTVIAGNEIATLNTFTISYFEEVVDV